MIAIKVKFASLMSSIYIVANGSNQSGKTTTAFNLAMCFATLAQKTLFINLNKNNWAGRVCSPDGQAKALNLFLDYSILADAEADYSAYDQVIINCPVHRAKQVLEGFSGSAEVIVPVELEYYGMNQLPSFFKIALQSGIRLRGILPVMWRKESEGSNAVLLKLQQDFGKDIFIPAIQRNYYLARQKEFHLFDLPGLTEKAAVTYLNLATELLKKN